MKVLHIFSEKNEGKVGGIEYHIQYVVAEQVKLGLLPYVLSFVSSGQDRLEVKHIAGADWYFLEVKDSWESLARKLESYRSYLPGKLLTIFRDNANIREKLRLIDAIRPDIVHQHDYLSCIKLNKAMAGQFKIVMTNHRGEYLVMKKTMLGRYFQDRFMRHFKYIIAPSRNLLPQKSNSYYIPNGADTNIFTAAKATEKKLIRAKMNLQGKVVFLCARRWAPTKGVIHLVKAMNRLEEETKKKAVFLFAGNDSEGFGEYKKQVQNLLHSCQGIDFRLFGNLNHEELLPLIHACDVGIIPSLMEGMSLFSIELISCGIPILATDVGGLPEIIKDGENGWLVPPANPQRITDEINRIVRDWPDSKLEISTDEFKAQYSWAMAAQKILEVYKKV